ncbi:MAG: hypothetical protein H6860_02290 [Rhodospirillales bacterium]|nr:hypothetical protein [Rhodospirillales bacterium]
MLGGLLVFIKDREKVADLNEIANDKNVQQVQKARGKTQSDTETVLKTIGQEGGVTRRRRKPH